MLGYKIPAKKRLRVLNLNTIHAEIAEGGNNAIQFFVTRCDSDEKADDLIEKLKTQIFKVAANCKDAEIYTTFQPYVVIFNAYVFTNDTGISNYVFTHPLMGSMYGNFIKEIEDDGEHYDVLFNVPISI